MSDDPRDYVERKALLIPGMVTMIVVTLLGGGLAGLVALVGCYASLWLALWVVNRQLARRRHG